MRENEEQGPSGALAGLRVLDLSTSVAGLQATAHLADNGAEVLLVEPPGGNRWRNHASWPLWNRGKQSLVADLRSPSSVAEVRDLAARADILIETFRPGVADGFGLGYSELSAAAPHLIYGSITGFGPTGKYAHVKAYEGTVMASLGIMQAYSVLHSRPGPAFASPWMCSASATQVLLQGVLSALYERQSSGLGQRVETSLVEAVASQDLNNFTHLFLRRRYPDAFQDTPFISPSGVPNSGMAFRTLVALTADGHWLQFGQLSERLFRALMRALGLEWMFDDPKWSTAPEFDDADVRMQFWEHMLVAARQKTLAEWQDIFEQDDDVWAEVYRRGSQLLTHPQLIHDGRVVDLEDATQHVVPAPGPLVTLDKTAGRASLRSPLLDEHLGAGFTAPGWIESATADPDKAQDASAGGTPLKDVTILELGMYFAGPLGATMLADLGARVIKVEPFEGDPGRNFTGFPEAGGTRTMQGKESIAVNLATEQGRQIVIDLIGRADVVLQSFRPGVARRLGFDPHSVRQINPDIVYVEAPGYGSSGPCAAKPSFAPTMGAASGFALRNLGDVPARPDLSLDEIKVHAARLFPATIIVGHADAFAAHAVATAIMLGLLARGRGMGGQRLETTMLATMSHVLSDQMISDSAQVEMSPDPDMLGLSALYRLYRCAEGWVFLAVTDDTEWLALVRALGDERLSSPQYETAEARMANDLELGRLLESLLSARSAQECEDLLLSADVSCVRAAEVSPSQVLMDNLLEVDGGLTVDVHHPLWEDHPRLKPAVRFSRSATVTPAGCLCGQSTEAVLRELGYSDQQRNDLFKTEIVRQF